MRVNNPETLAKLLRAIAKGTEAQANGHDIIFNAAADELTKNTVKGWGVLHNGVLNIRTVSDTRRSAIVNWLYLDGYTMYNHYTDEIIERYWQALNNGATVCPVEVTVLIP